MQPVAQMQPLPKDESLIEEVLDNSLNFSAISIKELVESRRESLGPELIGEYGEMRGTEHLLFLEELSPEIVVEESPITVA